MNKLTMTMKRGRETCVLVSSSSLSSTFFSFFYFSTFANVPFFCSSSFLPSFYSLPRQIKVRKIVIIFVPKKVRFLRGRKKVQGQKWTLREVRKNRLFYWGTVQSNFSTTTFFYWKNLLCFNLCLISGALQVRFWCKLLPGFSFSSDDCFQRSVCVCVYHSEYKLLYNFWRQQRKRVFLFEAIFYATTRSC